MNTLNIVTAQQPKLSQAISRPAIAGMVILFAFFGGLFAWSVCAPLAGAVIAAGSIAPEGATRVIQHLEGGIVEAFLVKEGDQVTRGTPLIRLHDIRARSHFEILRTQVFQLAVIADRLKAERAGVQAWFPSFPAQGTSEAEMVNVQQGRFELNQRSLTEEEEMLGQRIAELEAGILMTGRQNTAAERERQLLQQEIQMAEGLRSKGLMPLPRLLQLQRTDAAIEEAMLGRSSTIARSKEQVKFFKAQVRNLETKYHSRISAEMEEIAIRQVEATRNLQEAADVLRRTIVFAPVDGIVTQLRHHTVGAVLQPGEPLLHLVPSGETLVVEAHIRPVDIDAVIAEQNAQVRLLAYNQRNAMPMQAKVKTVSADLIKDQRSGEGYYLARLQMLPVKPNANQSVQLTAGMPVEVMIATRDNSIIDYVLAPIADAFRRSLRES